ncbi:MAG TPA: AAA family ATPase [Arthrobacter sp.]
MNTIASTRLSLPLGRTENQSPVSLDLDTSAHTLVVGDPGTGKTVLVRGLAEAANRRGFRVSTHYDEYALCVLPDLLGEATRRNAVLDSFGVKRSEDLPASVLAASDFRPVMLIIEDYAYGRFMPGAAPLSDRAKRLRASVLEFMRATRLREHAAGIHLVIVSERPDSEMLPAKALAGFGNVIMTVRPGKAPSPERLTAAFYGMAEPGDVTEAAASAAAAGTYGQAILADGDVAQFRFGIAGEE